MYSTVATLCECGCGGTPKHPNSRFISGHNLKGKPAPKWLRQNLAKGHAPGVQARARRARREDHHNWKGGRYENNGYVQLLRNALPKDHPSYEVNAKGASAYVGEHRAIIEAEEGRKLKRWEIVHHIDGDHSNNERSNLQLMTKRAHDKLHAQKKYGMPLRAPQEDVEAPSSSPAVG